ncbi:MAG TPA: hypothetical protein ENN66_01925 [Proteobacteria bacterium]|nr:hypothetical protein [Pseudomonadota bacterium]
MSQEKVIQILNDIATDLVMLEPGDLSGLGQMLNAAEELEKPGVGAGAEFILPQVSAFKNIIIFIIYDDFKDSEKSLETLSLAISKMQQALRSGGDGRGAEAAQVALSAGSVRAAAGPQASAAADEVEAVTIVEERAALKSEATEPDIKNDMPAVAEELFGGVDFSQDRDLYQGFIVESNEHLDTIEENILNLEQHPGDPEILNSIFHPFHTIKGVSGFMNLRQMNLIAHHLENLLDDARNHKFSLDGEATDLILDGVDFLKKMLAQLNLALLGNPLETMPVQAFLE